MSNIYVKLCFWEQRRETKPEVISDAIIAKNIFKLIEESLLSPSRINCKKNIPKHVIIKFLNIKDKEKNLKAEKNSTSSSKAQQ